MRKRWWRRGRDEEIAFNLRWGDLANYNTERAHGIVHTPEMDAEMAEKQRRYNVWIRG